MRRVAVFCGSSTGNNPANRQMAQRMGELLASEGVGLVFGGGRVGLMGVLADAVLAKGGEAIGVITEALKDREVGHEGLTKLHVVQTMHERKALMAKLAEGFVALPGGLGTLDEMCEILTWALLGIHQKPCGIVEVQGYWAPFLAFLDHAVEQGFLKREHRDLVLVDEDPQRLLGRMRAFKPPAMVKWVKPSEV